MIGTKEQREILKQYGWVWIGWNGRDAYVVGGTSWDEFTESHIEGRYVSSNPVAVVLRSISSDLKGRAPLLGEDL